MALSAPSKRSSRPRLSELPERSSAHYCVLVVVVSGECHLGGVDIFAREEAEALDLVFIACPPACHSWAYGYKPRNEAIAALSELVVCITVRELPATYTGMRFDYCYHCETGNHVKSGGCWTVKRAKQMSKDGMVLVVV